MSRELKKRIITSIILFITAILCTLISKLIFLVSILVIAYLCFIEWCNINYKYFLGRFWTYFLVRVLGLFYLIFAFILGAFFLRGDNLVSIIFFITVLCICICSDIGGYVFGKTFRGKKLTKISPKKTVSGSVGSFIFSILPIFLINFQNYIDIDFDFSLKNILFCLILSAVCQLGDLFISYFKRLNKIKNTGRILPGHGGLLDRIDGIIFAIPVASVLKLL